MFQKAGIPGLSSTEKKREKINFVARIVVFVFNLDGASRMVFNGCSHGMKISYGAKAIEMNAMFIQKAVIPLEQTPVCPAMNVRIGFNFCF